MVLYQCPRCHYETTHKPSMRNHYGRKTVCKTAFSRKSVKDCLQDLETKRRKTYEELERENKSLIECKTVVINNNNTYNIDNSKNINVNSFKDTNYGVLNDRLKEFKGSDIPLNRLLEEIFGNEKYPENHNVLICNKKRREIKKYDGSKFILDGRGDSGIQKFIDIILKNLDIVEDDRIDEFSCKLQEKLNNGTEQERREIIHTTEEFLNNVKDIVKTTHREVETF